MGNGWCLYDEFREGGSREYDVDVVSFVLGSSRGGGRRRGGRMVRGRCLGSVVMYIIIIGYILNLFIRILNLLFGFL